MTDQCNRLKHRISDSPFWWPVRVSLPSSHKGRLARLEVIREDAVYFAQLFLADQAIDHLLQLRLG
jgi:hypothetical protein